MYNRFSKFIKKHFVTVSPFVWFPGAGKPRATLRIRILFWREVSQLRWEARALRPLLQTEDNTILTIHARYSFMIGTPVFREKYLNLNEEWECSSYHCKRGQMIPIHVLIHIITFCTSSNNWDRALSLGRGQIYCMALFHCGFMKTLFAYHALINLSGSSTTNWMIV